MHEFRELLTNDWYALGIGYLFTICIETPILLAGLSPEHSMKRRFAAGLWLTACTYPIVILMFPSIFDATDERIAYLSIAETFAPAAECALFWLAFGPLKNPWRDMIVIVAANLASFGSGELVLWAWDRWLETHGPDAFQPVTAILLNWVLA